MIKIGRIEIQFNRIVFVAEGKFYSIPNYLYKQEYLNKQLTCEVNDNQFSKVVIKVL